MSFHVWLQTLRSVLVPRRRRRQRPLQYAMHRPRIEVLEDRSVPAFLAPVSYAVGDHPESVVTADFNGDGRLDVAAANYYGHDVSILLGDANGTFQPARNFAAGVYPWSLATGDFNGDGALDLVVANFRPQYGEASVLLGNGDGTFQSRRTFSTNSGSVVGLAVADFNADGRSDLAIAGHTDSYFGSRDDISVLLSNEDGTFAASYHRHVGGYEMNIGPNSIATGDFNNDGHFDLVWTDRYTDTFRVHLGQGNGTFGDPQVFASGPYPGAVTVADLNGDGNDDLVMKSNGISVHLGNGNGTFQPARSFASVNSPASIKVADLNDDGLLDLLTAGSSSSGNGAVSVLLGNVDGNFRPAQYFAAGSDLRSVAVGDFNSDGRADVAVPDYQNGNMLALLNTGDWRSLQVNGFPSPTTAGQTQTFTVTFVDSHGNPLTNYTGTVHFASSDPQAVLPADYTFTMYDHGTHIFSATLKTAGTQTITVIDTAGGYAGGKFGIAVEAAAASQIIISATSTVYSDVTFRLTVTVKDRYGNEAVGYTGTIYFKCSDKTAALPQSYTFTAANRGKYDFYPVLRKTGKQTITITDPLLGLSASVILNVKSSRSR